jgi:hypothetical protein
MWAAGSRPGHADPSHRSIERKVLRPARKAGNAPIAAVRVPVESRPTPKRTFIIPALILATQTDCAKNALGPVQVAGVEARGEPAEDRRQQAGRFRRTI